MPAISPHPDPTPGVHTDRPQPSEREVNSTGLFFLFIVYLIWGSTYLAIRIAVQEGSGFPPFTMSGTRLLVAGLLLLLIALLRRKRIWPTRSEWPVLIGAGLLLWTGGNGLVVWAEQRAASGLAALVVGSSPLWAAIIESLLERQRPSPRLIGALLIGLLGIGLLSAPVLRSGIQADVLSLLALALAAISWAAGSVLQSRNPIQLDPQVSSAFQSLVGVLGFTALVLITREPRPQPTQEAILAWLYLVIFGSMIGFTAFVQVLKRLPINIAMTYAYVNPVIAVLLGTIILQEPITIWTVAGAGLILLGVAGVFHERSRHRRSLDMNHSK
jgi:drug/metabolite transporter (DMT)-like permease